MKQTDRIGVNAVESIVLKQLQWIFREQTVSDWGIDAHVEVTDENGPTGRLLALQIKSGASFFRKKTGNLIYHGEKRHLRYWTNHSLPVIIVLHNPETEETVWQRVNEQNVQTQEDGKWSVKIPRSNVLNAAAKDALLHGVSDIAGERRLRLTLDLALMKEFAKQEEIYMKIEEWPNKTLGIRGVEVFFDDIDKAEPDYSFGIFVPSHDISRFMDVLWPWLSYEYVNEPDLSGFEEVTTHDLNVTVNEVGKAFLLLEDYWENGHREPQGMDYREQMMVENYEPIYYGDEPEDEEPGKPIADRDLPF